jgi:hypothetical protein
VDGLELALSDLLGEDKMAKVSDARESAALLEELNNQFEHDSDFGSSPPAFAAEDLALQDEFKADLQMDAIDSSPSQCATDRAIRQVDFSKCTEQESPVALSERSNTSKMRKMRVVDGRLQVVGFPADLKQPQYTSSPRTLTRTGSTYSCCSNFLSRIMMT